MSQHGSGDLARLLAGKTPPPDSSAPGRRGDGHDGVIEMHMEILLLTAEERSGLRGTVSFHRILLLVPAAPAAVHGNGVLVAHLLQVVSHQRRAEAAAAVEDDLGVLVRDLVLDVA